jgi:hypothetical protein
VGIYRDRPRDQRTRGDGRGQEAARARGGNAAGSRRCLAHHLPPAMLPRHLRIRVEHGSRVRAVSGGVVLRRRTGVDGVFVSRQLHGSEWRRLRVPVRLRGRDTLHVVSDGSMDIVLAGCVPDLGFRFRVYVPTSTPNPKSVRRRRGTGKSTLLVTHDRV